MKKIVSLFVVVTSMSLFAMDDQDKNKGLSYKKMKVSLDDFRKISSLDQAVNWIVSGFLADAREVRSKDVNITALQLARQHLPVSNPFYNEVIAKLTAMEEEGITSGLTTKTPGIDVIEIIPAKKKQGKNESGFGSGFKKGFFNSKK